MKRLIFAILVSPLISALVFATVEMIAPGRNFNATLLASIIPMFYLFTLLGLVVFGLPIFYLFKKLQILNLISLTIAGGVMGIIYLVLFQWIMTSRIHNIGTDEILPGFTMGGLTALVFAVLAGISVATKSNQ